MNLSDSDQGAQWFSQAGLRLWKPKLTANVLEMLCCLWLFLVPQLPSLPTLCVWLAWPCCDLARAESRGKTNPRRKGVWLPAGSATVLKNPDLIWIPGGKRTWATHEDDDEVKDCSFWWWFALGMISGYAQKPHDSPMPPPNLRRRLYHHRKHLKAHSSRNHRMDKVGWDHRGTSGLTSLLTQGHPRAHDVRLHPDDS